MKGDLLLCFISIVLPCVHGVQPFTCASCSFGSTNCTTCSTQNFTCATFTEFNTLGGGVSTNGSTQGCFPQQLCKPLTFTLTTAAGRHVQSTIACCSTNMCNKDLSLNVPPVGDLKNGVSCPACENYHQKECEVKSHIACTGAEEKCITLAGASFATKNESLAIRGCATKNACNLVKDDLIQFGGKVYQLTTKAVCTSKGVLSVISSLSIIFSSLAGIFFIQNFS